MDERFFMRKGEKIKLVSVDEHNNLVKKNFTIISRDGAGASSVSYIVSNGRKNGRLKEFYPSESNHGNLFKIIRQKDNQLYCSNQSPESLSLFEKMLNEYTEAYYTLDDAKKEAQKGNNSFGTFIPSFEILRGCDKNGNVNGSVYIWTMDNNGDFDTFRQYLDKVHKHPTHNPAKDMFTILNTLYNLTECVHVLYIAGLVHSDLKPENFGLKIRGKRYLTEQVQLFDVNSIYSLFSDFPNFSATKGFCAPEIFRGKVTIQSDLYSIGAILFNAIAVGKDFPDSFYSDEYYDHIDELVAQSALLNASPITANVRFQSAISKILKKCLAPLLRDRVDGCDELKADLKRACVFLIPAQYGDDVDLGSELRLIEIEKDLEKYNESNTKFAIQSQLFNHPLYEGATNTIKVLVAGFGVYGQLFLDSCIQAGQIRGKKLDITILTHDKEVYKKEYLSKRPAFMDFFEVDGEGDLSDTNYGKITFITPAEACTDKRAAKKFERGFKKDDTDYNKELTQELMLSECNSNYVFVSLGENDLNSAVAKTCAEVVDKFNLTCTVACVSSDNKNKKHTGVCTVNVTAKAEENDNFADIERMAFNAHLIWNSPLKLNANIKKLKQDFSEDYQHNSSVACVLAIKNVLYSCGIELKSLSSQALADAAEKYREYIKENKDVFAELVHKEHCRWTCEKLSLGWTCRSDLTECLDGNVNDKRKKVHPCIVKSRPDFKLEENYKDPATSKWIKEKWNAPCAEDSMLDDLDKLSLNLHRVFFAEAEKIRRTFSLDGEEAYRIRSIIQNEQKSVVAFNEWMLCMKRIWKMDEKQAKLYNGYKDKFTDTLKSFSKYEKDEVTRYVDLIHRKITPIHLAYRLRDYKASDKDLINEIPFILTHREDYKLFIPLTLGSNTERFNNVSAPTLINPALITYGVYLRTFDDIRESTDTITQILSYMDKKEIKSRLRFILIYRKNEKQIEQFVDDLIYNIKKMHSRVGKVMVAPVDYESDIASAIKDIVETDAFEHNGAYLSALLMGAGFYKDKPYYSFNSAKKEFVTSKECTWLKYIKSGQFITVPDMLSMKKSVGIMDTLPEYTDYSKLWKYYKKVSYAWKDMCAVLEQYSEANDLIASFTRKTDFTQSERLEYIIPNELRNSYIYIISQLRDVESVIHEDSFVEYNTVESCKVVIIVDKNNIDAARNLFSNPHLLQNKKNIHIKPKSRKVEVLYNNLVVNELDMGNYPDYSDKKNKIGEILSRLQQEKYIYNLSIKENKRFSFVYSTKQSKQLMTAAGRLLEIYVYHKLQESGFDDVVSGYEINWGDTNAKSEADAIVTAGFSSFVIECKSQDKLSQDYYYKLSCLAKQFGINAIPVLIADTHENNEADKNANEIQRERGKMMGVVTICDRDKITNIDAVLRKMLKGKY